MTTIVVIGGGITGLSTLYYLQKELKLRHQEMNLVLIEASETLGGKIRTVQNGEFIMETGADSIVSRKTNVAPLLEELQLTDQVVYNATGTSFIYTSEGLKKIPDESVFGIPLSLRSLAESELVSAEGKVVALKDYYTPNETFTRDDSLGEFLEAFLGKEIVQKQIAPVISGVYSGDLHDLTIASTFPYLLDYKNTYGSIMGGLAENKQKYLGAGNKKFISFKGGVSALIDALEDTVSQAGAEIYKGTAAAKLKKLADGYEIALSNGEKLEADYVVLSTLASSAKELLQDPHLNEDFDQLYTKSLISVYLAFDIQDEELPYDGTGFITGKGTHLKCDACTWTSRKWEHTSENKRLLMRLFYKSSNPHYEELIRLTDDELKQVGMEDINRSLGITAEPVSCEVTKWHDDMPNYHLKHRQVVESLEHKLKDSYPNVILAGCSYYGVGIPDCIANGENTAGQIMERNQEANT
ncbi:protoporphyrinogen oxidase [Paenibacillus glucanolyticus]|uniref:protoporphyrinogen oxidase n=1 Tax=Paenibacillus glucanolyticus TaxID=59843 RepID=UPI00096FC4C8|nr:protoporphyrinogen oxidase [Paenibacillus glucanolyticus]OMF83551.1 protoporphyrinogen oxidase [Paenibacillus glucanolyticus]